MLITVRDTAKSSTTWTPALNWWSRAPQLLSISTVPSRLLPETELVGKSHSAWRNINVFESVRYGLWNGSSKDEFIFTFRFRIQITAECPTMGILFFNREGLLHNCLSDQRPKRFKTNAGNPSNSSLPPFSIFSNVNSISNHPGSGFTSNDRVFRSSSIFHSPQKKSAQRLIIPLHANRS